MRITGENTIDPTPDSSPSLPVQGSRFHTLLAVVVVALFIYLFRFCWSAVFGSPDTCWILAAGRYIIDHGTLPAHDVFSWTMPQQPWVLYQWLFEVIQATLLKIGGLWLVGLAAYMTVGILYGFALPRWWLSKGIPAWLTFTASILGLNYVWFYVRPQLASFVFVPMFLFVLEKHRLSKSGTRAIFLLPLLMVLWANLHAWWFIGLLGLLCYALFETGRKRKMVWLALALSALAVMINPYGFQLVTYNLSFVRDADFTGLAELKPPFAFNTFDVNLFMLYCLASSVVLFSKFKMLPKAGVLFAAICTVASLRMARFMPLAILATWPYVGLALMSYEWRGRCTLLPQKPYWRWLHLCAAILIPIGIWMFVVPDQRAALNALTYSRIDGLRFVAVHKLQDERLYNDEITGAQMLFLGMRRVFIDNRFDMYGKSFCDDWIKASHALPGWRDYMNKFAINAIVLEKDQPLCDQLLLDPGWLLAYDDDRITYWLKNTPENRHVLDAWHVSPRTVAHSSLPDQTRNLMIKTLYLKHTAQGDAFAKDKRYSDAAAEYTEALDLAPDSANAHHNVIHTLALAGEREKLEDELRQARPFFWKFDNESASKNATFTSAQQLRIDEWVHSAAQQLLNKYGH